jgi:CPA2 family monovalent cation:H+ antiporter-2
VVWPESDGFREIPAADLTRELAAGMSMPHSISLITTISAALGLALVLGLIAVRLRLPALVGYLVAGVIRSATPKAVADMELSQQLAEIGVMLLMFGVGLHFSLKIC